MPEVNRKKVRAMATELAQAPEGEILERFKSSMTTSEFEALQRVCRDRGIAVPAEHGEITPEPDLPQRIISAWLAIWQSAGVSLKRLETRFLTFMCVRSFTDG